ncbi:scavenger receptor class B member 1-like isoform X1 [Bombyx mandarina]|uniref:Scavenger receptor class B member 1 n=2 Tax=Bombyx mandarina TaxID=7092 RepID=A0A6J2KI66_BOMMA|nr:scavenger receptor class B member 1-like isoform X1 [Bombyx mandarina]
MVVKTRRNSIKAKMKSRRNILASVVFGVAFLIIPAIVIFIDPIFLVAQYQLKLTKNSLLSYFLKKELKGALLEVYLFNVTNAERFLDGADKKMKMKEIGPFVYQEYRSNEDIDFDNEAPVIRFTPKLRTVFMPDKSVGDPKDITLNVPNISLLTVSTLMEPYPFVVRQLYNILVNQVDTEGIVARDVHSCLWGFRDPIVSIAKTLAPGLIYYDSIGILEKLYDPYVKYRIEMGREGVDKFKVLNVQRTRKEKMFDSNDPVNKYFEFNDTYEGAAFPPLMTPQTPVNLYRLGICKSFQMKYQSQEDLKLGAKLFVYGYSNSTFENTKICDSKGWCPFGLMDLSSCFYHLPMALSKSHFLDADPLLLEKVEGLKPNRADHDSSLLVDPKAGLTIGTTLELQLNIMTTDLTFNHQSRLFSDTIVPIARAKITLPEPPEETRYSLKLMYETGPQILLILEIISCSLGILLLLNSGRLAWRERRRELGPKTFTPLQGKISAQPLLSS